jgi:hypothetical protein
LSGKDPVSFFAAILETETAPLDLLFQGAKELAPYMHPKLTAVEARTGGMGHEDRLAMLQAMMADAEADDEGTRLRDRRRLKGAPSKSATAQISIYSGPGPDARSPCLRRQGAPFESRLRINAAAGRGGTLRLALSSVSATWRHDLCAEHW